MEAISFRVTSKGVYLNLNPEIDYDNIKKALIKHTAEANNFFTGVDLYINPNGRILSADEIKELIEILSRYKILANYISSARKEKQAQNHGYDFNKQDYQVWPENKISC